MLLQSVTLLIIKQEITTTVQDVNSQLDPVRIRHFKKKRLKNRNVDRNRNYGKMIRSYPYYLSMTYMTSKASIDSFIFFLSSTGILSRIRLNF